MTRIGIIEDNLDFRAELAFHLRRAGYEVALESGGLDVDEALGNHPCDLIVLDLGLPDEDGLDIAKRLRVTQPWLGIVMLTARVAVEDRLVGLEGGADAYLSKPVDMRELVVTIASVLRRLDATDVRSAGPCSTGEHGWTLDTLALTLTSPAWQRIALTANEAALLSQLAQAGTEPASRQELAAAIGHTELDFDERRLEVAFCRLRQKIDAAAPASRVIVSARSRGYVFGARLRLMPTG